MNKVRDCRKPVEYWEQLGSSIARYGSLAKAREIYRISYEQENPYPLGSVVDYINYNCLQPVCYLYSRGDDLNQIRQKSLLPAVESGLFFKSELAAHPDREHWHYLTRLGERGSPKEVYETYILLAYCVCLDLDAKTMRTLAPVIAKAGEDRLVDLILSRYEPNRVLAQCPAQPEIFGDLDQLVDATPEQRVKLIEHYLDNWASQISKLHGAGGIGGVAGLMRAKSNADLDTDEFLNPSYVGWWAWEAALMVRVFGIDDTSFADHRLYPVDFARYRNEETKGILGKITSWFGETPSEKPLPRPKVRDTRKPLEYWDRLDTVLAKYRSIEGAREIYQIACKQRPDHGPLESVVRYIHNSLDSMCYFYARGDDVDQIRQKSLMVAVENSLFYQAELAEHPDRVFWRYLTDLGNTPSGPYQTYFILACFVCLGADKETMRNLSPLIAKAGEDRLVDLILRQYEPDRIIADHAAQPRIFGDLDKLIDATPEQRIKLIKHYLDRWAVQISKLQGTGGVGTGTGLKGVKSNADLDKEKFIRRDYSGRWAWEVALMVRVFGIDDTSFADHMLYPVDLARYRQGTAGPWPIGQKSDGSTPVSKDMTDGIPGRPRFEELQLAIVLDLPADTPASGLVDANALIGEDPAREQRHYLYLAVDEQTEVLQQDPLMVAAEASTLVFEASYTPDNNVVNLRRKMIDQAKKTMQASPHHDGMVLLRKILPDSDPAGLMELYGADWQHGLQLPIAVGEDWAAWINTIQPRPGGHFVFATVFNRITPTNELFEVRGAFNRRPDLEIGDVMNFWEHLVRKYTGIEWQ